MQVSCQSPLLDNVTATHHSITGVETLQEFILGELEYAHFSFRVWNEEFQTSHKTVKAISRVHPDCSHCEIKRSIGVSKTFLYSRIYQ